MGYSEAIISLLKRLLGLVNRLKMLIVKPKRKEAVFEKIVSTNQPKENIRIKEMGIPEFYVDFDHCSSTCSTICLRGMNE